MKDLKIVLLLVFTVSILLLIFPLRTSSTTAESKNAHCSDCELRRALPRLLKPK